MTVAPRQPSRKALYIPFVLLLVVAVVWTFAWFGLRTQARERMDAGAAELRAAGYTVSWQDRTFGGYPFRIDSKLTGFRIAEPSGWGLAAPSIRAEAFVYALHHWVAVAPDGVVLERPLSGPLTIKGKALRASLGELDQHPPRLTVEGSELTFQQQPDAQPYLLRSARKLVLAVRPGPQDQGAVLLRVEDAGARLPGPLARLAQNQPVDINVELILSKMSAMQGRDWRTMAQRWAAAGGTATVRNARLSGGGSVLAAHGGSLSVGADGRMEGGLDLDLAKAGGALGELSGMGAALTFEDGQTLLGRLPIAPAPRVY